MTGKSLERTSLAISGGLVVRDPAYRAGPCPGDEFDLMGDGIPTVPPTKEHNYFAGFRLVSTHAGSIGLFLGPVLRHT